MTPRSPFVDLCAAKDERAPGRDLMIVGVPREIKPDEYRVAITPAGVREMSEHGHGS